MPQSWGWRSAQRPGSLCRLDSRGRARHYPAMIRLTSLAVAAAVVATACAGPDLSDTRRPIVGGSASANDAVVALLGQVGAATYLCSGALISPRVILTAAHCVADRDSIDALFGSDIHADGGVVTTIAASYWEADASWDPSSSDSIRPPLRHRPGGARRRRAGRAAGDQPHRCHRPRPRRHPAPHRLRQHGQRRHRLGHSSRGVRPRCASTTTGGPPVATRTAPPASATRAAHS